MLEDEIDLRRYLDGLLRHWPLIAALTLISAAAAAWFTLSQPDIYEAVALVSVSAPRYNLQLDGASANGPLPVRAYPELAQSGDVVAQVLSKTQSLLPANGRDLPALQGRLSAEAASDLTLLRLKVRDSDPQLAANLANVWADVFAARAGVLYLQDQANLQVYTSQLADARGQLQKTESDLAAFQSKNQAHILAAQLNSQQASLTDYLNRQHELELLAQDTHNLIDRLSSLPATAAASPAEDLALLMVTGRIYASASMVTGTSQAPSALPVQVQLTAGQPLAGPTVADQLALANNLRATIAARLAESNGKASALEPQILALQGQVAEAGLQESDLTQARDLAASQYKKLASQVQDATLVVQSSSNTVQIASRAVVPSAKVGPHRATNILLAGALGLVFGILASLAIDFWRSSASRRSSSVQAPVGSAGGQPAAGAVQPGQGL